jgi:uncharacterized protein YxeA
MVWPVILGFARTYATYIVWPVAFVVGIVGYNIESYRREGKEIEWKSKTIEDERLERQLKENEQQDVTEVKELKYIPKLIFDKNK